MPGVIKMGTAPEASKNINASKTLSPEAFSNNRGMNTLMPGQSVPASWVKMKFDQFTQINGMTYEAGVTYWCPPEFKVHMVVAANSTFVP